MQHIYISDSITLIDRSGHPSKRVLGTTNSTLTGNSIFGPTTFYSFSIEFSSSVGLAGLEVGGQILEMQDGMFIVPSLSSVSPGLSGVSPLDSSQAFTINITTAVSLKISSMYLNCRTNHSLSVTHGKALQVATLPYGNFCKARPPNQRRWKPWYR